MKLALLVPGGVDRSGEYRVVPVLLALLRRLSVAHEVHVFALAQESQRGQWMLEGAQIHNIGGRGSLRRLSRVVAAVLRENRRGRFDLVQSIWSGACGLGAICAARLMRIPSVVHYAGGELEALPQIGYGGRLGWKGRAGEALVLRGATRLTAASLPMIEKIAAHGRQAHLIPLGVDLHAWPPRPPHPRQPQEPLRLVHVASLNRVKDQPTLLRAMAALTEAGVAFSLEVIGEDTLAGEIQALAQRLGIGERVTFRGFLTQRELRPVLERAHVNVISSRHEAGPVAMLEAAVAGVPTVGTAVGHIAEWAPHACLAAPVGDAAALAAAIIQLAEDERLRLRIAGEAQKRAVEQSADATCARFHALYETLVQPEAGAQGHGG